MTLSEIINMQAREIKMLRSALRLALKEIHPKHYDARPAVMELRRILGREGSDEPCKCKEPCDTDDDLCCFNREKEQL